VFAPATSGIAPTTHAAPDRTHGQRRIPSSSYHNDHLGSTSVATNQAATVASQQEYDPWGKVRSGGIGQTTINFTGQRLDGTGLLYYHARMYDPLLGRFVSADSIIPNPANPQYLNRYSYGLNNPVKNTDPTGHVVCLLFCAIGAVAGTIVEPVGGTIVGGVAGSAIDDAILAGAATLFAGGAIASYAAAGGGTNYTTDAAGAVIPIEPDAADVPAAPDAGPAANGINTNEDNPSSPLGKLTERKSGYWKAKGIDPEILKDDVLGGSGSKYDVYTDAKGNVWIKRKGEKDDKAIYAGKLEDLEDDPTLKPDEDKEQNKRDKRSGTERGRK
jgi:RHS repeat-associated protein